MSCSNFLSALSASRDHPLQKVAPGPRCPKRQLLLLSFKGCKVRTFWEAHKIWKKSSSWFGRLLSKCTKHEEDCAIFVCFSESPNFTKKGLRVFKTDTKFFQNIIVAMKFYILNMTQFCGFLWKYELNFWPIQILNHPLVLSHIFYLVPIGLAKSYLREWGYGL